MSKYTTGEVATLTGVSVRTVQYYDDRGILVPSELSDGGRRLYTEDDLKKMRVICFLREIGLSINSISRLFAEKNPKNIIGILLEQQKNELSDELAACQGKLDLIQSLESELKLLKSFSVESIGDIAQFMKQKNKLTKMRLTMVLTGIPVTLLQCTAIALWITSGLWWLILIWAGIAIPWGILISKYYFSHVSYICPECHEVFKPKIKESFFAYHTTKMRNLTCPKCHHRGLCVEIYSEKKEEK